MASSIDPTKPVDGVPAVKADLRANLLAAKAEIEALQLADGSDVRGFGAVGNGTTDDTAAIQAAIDAATSLTAHGGIVFFPPGQYLISDTVVLKNRVRLVGSGMFQSWITLDDDSDCDMLALDSDTVEMWGVQELGFDGNSAQQGADNGTGATNFRGLVFVQTGTVSSQISASALGLSDPRPFIQNVFVWDTKGDGVWIYNVRELICDGLEVQRSERRNIFCRTADSQFSNCSFGTGKIGANIFHNAGCRMSNINIWGQGAGDDSSGTYTTLWGNIVTALTAGEETSGYPYPNQNSVGNNLMAGCGMICKDSMCSWNGLDIEDTDGSGIWFAGSPGVTFSGVVFNRVGEVQNSFTIADTMAAGGLPASKDLLRSVAGSFALVGHAVGTNGVSGRPANGIELAAGGPYHINITIDADAFTSTPFTRTVYDNTIIYNGQELVPDRTATQIADDADAINTEGKVLGRRIWDSTNSRFLVASGSGPTDTWLPLLTDTAVTPS